MITNRTKTAGLFLFLNLTNERAANRRRYLCLFFCFSRRRRRRSRREIGRDEIWVICRSRSAGEVKKRRWRRERCLALTETDWPSATVSKTSRPCPCPPPPRTSDSSLSAVYTRHMLCVCCEASQHRQRHSQFSPQHRAPI